MSILQRLRNALGVKSPSEELAKENAKAPANFQRGLEEGKKNPLFRMTEDGHIMQVRELTQEEKYGVAMCRVMVARAFPGYFDDEEGGNGV